MAYVRINDEEPDTGSSSVMRRSESMDRRERKSSINVWTIVGGLALVAAAAAVIVSLPDIKRYIKISTM
jgi:hypothetical protein